MAASAAAVAIASMSRAARVSKGSAGTSPTWWKGESARSQPGASSSAPSVSQKKVAATRAYAIAGAARGTSAKASAPSARKRKAVGRQFAPASSRWASETSTP
jgi:hypothetical protein